MVLKGSKVEDAFTYLIAELEREGDTMSLARTTAEAMQAEAALFKQRWTPDNSDRLDEMREVWRKEAIEAQRAAAYRDAERHWREWRETELSNAQATAMRRISPDEIARDCGSDAQRLIEEKRAFAKDYVASNYFQSDAMKVTREDFFQSTLQQIYPEVRKEVETKAAIFREKLTQEREDAIRNDNVIDLYLAAMKPKTKGKGKAKSVTANQQLSLATPMAGAKRSAEGLIRTSSVAASDHVTVIGDDTDTGMILEDAPTVLPSPVPGETPTERIEAVVAAMGEQLGGNPFLAFGHAAAMLDPFLQRESSICDDAQAINPAVAATRGVSTSVHGPGNAMEDDPSPPPAPVREATPDDDPLAAFKAVNRWETSASQPSSACHSNKQSRVPTTMIVVVAVACSVHPGAPAASRR
ncbi:hypothetical protein EDB92DRAFT_1939465 [Lactarius akahatsu]|uniref:Uncharacterized protein n=1 Tax=Lactarius akahatsu TaxID=416441 RepID=A0AAD4LS11_9AGAM|nr:hypothetical protein EDB92DRAFT_1939465 [Lactarius akahatsu]